MPGTRLVNPTRPCVPGVNPVPSEVRLVAVVDGTPAVPGAESASSEERYGAVAAYRSSSREPSPSTRNSTYAGASGSTSPVGAASTSLPRARPIAGTTSPSPRWPYAGSTKAARHPEWVRAESCSANDSRRGTASWPSAAAETRSEKSSEASTPV